MELINKTDEIWKRLRKEGKVSEIKFTEEQIAEWERQLKEIREDSIRKQNASWLAAKDVRLD